MFEDMYAKIVLQYDFYLNISLHWK